MQAGGIYVFKGHQLNSNKFEVLQNRSIIRDQGTMPYSIKNLDNILIRDTNVGTALT